MTEEVELVPLEGFEDTDECPNCQSGEFHYHEYVEEPSDEYDKVGDVWRCQECGFQWYGVDAVTPDLVERIGIRAKWGTAENYKYYITTEED